MKAVAAGCGHTCALVVDGRIACFGDNGASQCNVPCGIGEATAVAAQTHLRIANRGRFFFGFGSNGLGLSEVPRASRGFCF